MKLSFLTAGPRVDSLTGAFSRELEAALVEQELYRAYLVAYSGALLILLGYLATRLIASYRLLNAANEGLERRVIERTRELSDALRQLKESEAQLIQTEKMSSLGQMVAGRGARDQHAARLRQEQPRLGDGQAAGPDAADRRDREAARAAALRHGQTRRTSPQQFAPDRAAGRATASEHHVADELQTLAKDGLYGIDADLRDRGQPQELLAARPQQGGELQPERRPRQHADARPARAEAPRGQEELRRHPADHLLAVADQPGVPEPHHQRRAGDRARAAA